MPQPRRDIPIAGIVSVRAAPTYDERQITMRTGTWFAFTALAVSVLVGAAGAADFEEKRFYVTPFGGWTFFDTERRFASGQDLNDDVYFGGRAGVRMTDLLWLELAGGYAETKDCASCIENWTHYSGNLMLSPASSRTINPFLSVGGGWSTFRHAIGESEDAGTFEAAAGLRARLSDAFGIRLEARNVLALPPSSWSSAHIDDIVVGAGLTFAFGGGAMESDGDSDGDGVSDSQDRCPDTPRGCKVDAHGCGIDSDGDGVCDGRDRCPGTPSGTKVDKDGCPVVEREKQLEMELLDTGRIRISNINFDHDQSTIRPDAHAVLDTVGRVLTKWPGLEIDIHGHTDSQGSEAYNHELSGRRAEAVRAYLLEHFPQFKPAQLRARGFGESQPLVPNVSAATMQLNRRVEFVVLNKEILKRQP